MHDGDAQPGRVSAACFDGLDGCDDELCACCCHDEPSEVSRLAVS
ncbi:hypothetical protein [Paractinoplanes maris]|nr:hypothetical protein [Actinoplanes maris]